MHFDKRSIFVFNIITNYMELGFGSVRIMAFWDGFWGSWYFIRTAHQTHENVPMPHRKKRHTRFDSCVALIFCFWKIFLHQLTDTVRECNRIFDWHTCNQQCLIIEQFCIIVQFFRTFCLQLHQGLIDCVFRIDFQYGVRL